MKNEELMQNDCLVDGEREVKLVQKEKSVDANEKPVQNSKLMHTK